MTLKRRFFIKRIYTEEQKAKNLEAQQRWRKANPEEALARGRKSERKRRFKRYGLTEVEHNKLWESQEKVCAICRNETSNGRGFHVDHDHITNKVRGILCHNCNLMLGNAKDNISTLENALSYLRRIS